MKHYRILLMLICAVAAPIAALAQTAVTALHGTITDPSGAVISKAKLSIVNPDTGFKSEHITGDRGEYAFEQITPGTYTVQADAPGFAPQKQIVELLVNQPRTIDFKLGVGSSAAETIEVVDTLSALNTNDATIGTPFDTKQIQALPFEGNNVLDLLSLQAGVLFLGDKTTQQQDADSRSGAVDGARSDQSNVTLDGLDDNDQNKGYAFTGILRSTRDSVEEFRVVTTNANADSGRSSGAQVALVTRGGTNKFHGSAYEYYRPTNTVANDWFNKQAELSSGLPNIPGKLLRNTFGGSFGAPILKDKLFGFVAYEGQHTAESAQQIRGVPTDSLRSGNVTYTSTNGSVTLTPSEIAGMDPLCSSLGSCPLGPGVDPAMMTYLGQLPEPNGVQEGDGVNTASYTFASPNPINLNTAIAKLDFSPNSRHHLFVRANLQDDHTTGPIQFPGSPASYEIFDNSKGIAAGDTWTLSPTLVNNLRYGLVRQGYANRGSTTTPYVTISGISNLIGTGNTSQIVNVPTHNIADDITWVKGNHTLQFGGNYRLIFNNRSSDATLFNTAEVTYVDLGLGAIAGTGSDLDPDAFGYPTVASISSYDAAIADATGMITFAQQYYNNSLTGGQLTPLAPGQWVTRHFLTNEVEYYGQDSWKIKPNLTLTFGLRQTLLQVPYERNGQEVVPNVNIGQWLDNRWSGASKGQVVQPDFSFIPGGKANKAPGFWNMDKADLAPRFAVAWQPTSKLNIRAGLGVYYDHFGQGIVDSFDQKGEFGTSTANQAPVGATNVDTAPRFGGPTDVPLSILPPINPTSLTPGDYLNLAWGVDQSLKSPYSYAFNLGYQLQLRKGLMLESTYTGRLGRRLLQMRDVSEPTNLTDPVSGTDYYTAERQIDQLNDASTPVANVKPIPYWENMFPWMAGGGMTATQAVYQTYFGNSPGPEAGFRGNEASALFILDTIERPCTNGATLCPSFFDPQYSSLYAWSSMGTSSYHGLQLALHQQTMHGLQFDTYYTFSHSIDLGSDAERTGPSATSFGGSFSQIINVYNPKGNRGPSDYDVRHAVNINVMDELPFGRGRLLASQANKFTNFFIGGWNLSGLTHWTSGLPFSSIDGLGWNTDWADQSWNVQSGDIKSGGHKHDALGQPNAFPDHDQALNNVRPPYAGETGSRNNYRGDGYFSVDTGVSKIFPVTERQQFKFAAEAFNVTNAVRFDPNSVVNDPYFGASTYGQYTALLTQGRRMQFSLRYSF
jgi:Carboxypeptidase regulatory-like domain/TonB dependent receptor